MGDRIASGMAGGALKGSLAVSDGQGWQLLSPPGTASQVLTTDPTAALGVKWAAGGGGSGVTSVDMSVPSWLAVTGNPITTSGTLAVAAATGQTANRFLATPNGSTGAVDLRAIVAADLPTTGLNIASHYGAITADSDGATVTFDLGASDKHAVTLGGDRTLALSNATTGQVFTVILTQDATGSRTVTWWSGIKWAGGSAPTLTTTASKADIFTFICYGANTYYGMVAGQNL